MAHETIKWIGHASFVFEAAGKTIFIDPFNINVDTGKADIIFITHSHFDHLDLNAIKKIAVADTHFVAPAESKSKIPYSNVMPVEPNKSYSVLGIDFETIPAYNIRKERLGFHPKSNGWVGYIIKAGAERIYHAGDTDFVEEMKSVNADTAMIPIGGTYTMDVEEAIEAANTLHSKRIIPMHYKALLGKDGSNLAEEAFRKSVRNAEIMKEVQEPSYSFK
ncbi:MAG: MBL fold metallo-hydrolase [Candidatus Micrarchaeia archaeon]